MMRPFLLFLLVIHLAVTGLSSQVTPAVAARVWRVQDGLADQVIQAVLQGPDHFLWIGTPSGLLRFDGQTFFPYTGLGKDELASGVTCLFSGSDGTIYAGTEGAGLVRFHGAQVEVLSSGQGITDPIIRAGLEDSSHNVWVGTDHGLFVAEAKPDGRRDSFKLATNAVSASVIEDHKGIVWSGGSELVSFSHGRMSLHRLRSRRDALRVKAVFEDSDGTIFVGAVSGLFAGGADRDFRAVSSLPGNLRMFARLPSGHLLAGTAGNGLYVRQSEGFRRVEISSLPSQTLLSGVSDAEGNTWIGTQSGLVRLGETNLQLLSVPTFSSDFGTISSAGNGSFWFCSNGVYKLKDHTVHPYRFPGINPAIVRSVMRDSRGATWVGTAGRGAFLFESNGRRKQFTREIGVDYIRGFLEARDGSIWIATDGGLSLWKDGKISNFHKAAGAPHTLVLSMLEDSRNRLWLGTQRGVFLFESGAFHPLPGPLTLPSGPIWSIAESRDERLWFGTNAGLFLWQTNRLKQVPLSADLRSQTIFHIMAAQEGLWISGPTQILHVPFDDLLQGARSGAAPQPAAWRIYSVTDAFPSAELFGGMQRSGGVDAEGNAWFPSSLGPIHATLEPDLRRRNQIAMSVHVLVDGKPWNLSTPLSLRAGTQTLQVDYGPIMLSSQIGIRFRQRLSPENTWTSLTAGRSTVYTNIAAGRHTYSVQALDSEQRVIGETHFEVDQRSYVYERPWFWTLLLVVLLGVIYRMYRLRIERMQVTFHAVAKERSRLAREMHDTLIQGCQAVSALLEAVLARSVDSKETATWLSYARDQINTTIVEARAAVWDLRHQDAHESIEDALIKMTQQTFNSRPVKITFNKQGAEPRLDPAVTHELIMGAREALINALAHSAATEVSLELLCTHHLLTLRVSDNGKGFCVEEEELSHNHFGLLGMGERMTRIGGTCAVSSIPFAGTLVSLTYKLHSRGG